MKRIGPNHYLVQRFSCNVIIAADTRGYPDMHSRVHIDYADIDDVIELLAKVKRERECEQR